LIHTNSLNPSSIVHWQKNNDDVNDDTAKNNFKTIETKNDKNNDTVSKDDRMNVLILYPDDWRHNSVGSENPIVRTPFLDSLADGGMRFRQNCVTTSICWISRATLFSGQWASRHKSWKLKCPHFTTSGNWNRTWPALLQKDGYFVGHVGKWQFQNHDAEQRFDWHSIFDKPNHWFQRDGQRISAEDMAREDAIRFLQQRPKDKPFAMTVAFFPPKASGTSSEPGGQWEPKPEIRKMYDNVAIPEPYNHTHAFSLLPIFLKEPSTFATERWRQRFSSPHHYQEALKNTYSLITQVDDACRLIVEELKAQGIYNNTMVIFTTDNGMFHGSHGLAGKWYPYQESIRVPLIVHDPRMPADKVGTLSDDFTLNVDLAETILGAAGLKPHEMMQGRDISDLYLPKEKEGKTALERNPWRDEFFYEFSYLEESEIPSSNALVRKQWKYIDWYMHNHTQLFNLKEDPLELTDVKDYPSNVGILAEMKKTMTEYKNTLKEPGIGCKEGNHYFIGAPDAEPISSTKVTRSQFI